MASSGRCSTSHSVRKFCTASWIFPRPDRGARGMTCSSAAAGASFVFTRGSPKRFRHQSARPLQRPLWRSTLSPARTSELAELVWPLKMAAGILEER